MFDLTGRKALVTGASGGIGEAIARQLHSQGATVGLHGTRVERLEALALGELAPLGVAANPHSFAGDIARLIDFVEAGLLQNNDRSST